MQPTVSELLLEASTLMVVGMIVVFVFLTTLIGAVNLIAWINSKLPAETPPAQASRQSRKAKVSTSDNQAPVAAIAAAVHKYRQNRK